MKNNLLLLTSIALVILFSSCQKESSEVLPASSLKIKTYTEDVKNGPLKSVTTYNVSYDGSNRIVAVTDASDPNNKIHYGYPSNKHYTVDVYFSSVVTIHVDYFLNDQSMIDSSFQYNITDDSSTEKFSYNAAHQLTQLKDYAYSKITGSQLLNTTTFSYDGAGNITKTQDTDGFTEILDYHPGLVNVLPEVMPVKVPNKKGNLVKQYTLNHNGNLQFGINYTYTFDSKDRISTITETYDDGTVVVKTYTYVD
jgi:hypothetical protein